MTKVKAHVFKAHLVGNNDKVYQCKFRVVSSTVIEAIDRLNKHLLENNGKSVMEHKECIKIEQIESIWVMV